MCTGWHLEGSEIGVVKTASTESHDDMMLAVSSTIGRTMEIWKTPGATVVEAFGK